MKLHTLSFFFKINIFKNLKRKNFYTPCADKNFFSGKTHHNIHITTAAVAFRCGKLPAHTPAILLCNKQLFIVRNYFIVMARQALHTHIHTYSQIAAYTTCLHNVELIIIISVLLHPLNSHYSPSQLLVMIVLLSESESFITHCWLDCHAWALSHFQNTNC